MEIIHSSGFQGLSIVDRYFSLARGYLEASRVLCNAMITDDYTPQFANTRVILHLCRHAVELFLKGAISRVTNSRPPTTHHLVELVDEYERVLPEPQFRFEVPFDIEALGTTPDFFAALTDLHHKTLDQRYRYPTDRAGNPFSELEGFAPVTFMSELEGLSKAFLLVELRLEGLAQ